MNILVVKTGALGDVVRSSFVAQALKEKYNRDNKVSLYWITEEKAKYFLINNPYVDKIVLSNNKESIRRIKFDLIVNLEEDEENCRFVSSLNYTKLLGAFFNNGKIDYTAEGSAWFDMSRISKFGIEEADLLKKKNKKTHRQLISQIIGVNYGEYEPFLRLTEKQREIARTFSRRHGLSRSEIVIGINTGAADTWPKSLSVKKTVEMINKLYKKYNAKIVLFGGQNETERNKEIKKYSKAPIIDTGCGNDLLEFPALVSVCNVFITTDSLGLHVALALKRKTICLIGPTSPSEIDMYDLGVKVIAKSKDVCSYKRKTNCMDKIDVSEAIDAVIKIINFEITVIITSFKEPKTIGKAIEAALNQKTNHAYSIVVSAPDKETLDVAREYASKYKNISLFQDPGKGKSYAINLLLDKIKSDVLIMTDGDVWMSENAIEEIANMFLDPEIGCVCGRPVPVESVDSKYGYWANFLFNAAHKWRKQAFEGRRFLECSGYLFAFRKSKVMKIPLDVAEDTIIPYYLWNKGYLIGYAEEARVYVKNVDNWKDWVNQKKRTSKAHETLSKYVDTKTTQRTKTFFNEAKGIGSVLRYPRSAIQILWTAELILARLYMWTMVFTETKFAGKIYQDAWDRVESTK